MTQMQLEEMAKIQNVIQHYERGVPMKSLDEAFDDVNVVSVAPKYSNAEESKLVFMNRLEKLCITMSEYCKLFRETSSAFEMFIVKAMYLSLHMYNALNNRYYEEIPSLVPDKYMQSWSTDENMLQKFKKFALTGGSHKKVGGYFSSQSSWNSFIETCNGDESLVHQKLSSYIYLKLDNVSSFSFSTFTFPDSIVFLSISLKNFNSNTFRGIKFPNVRYLLVAIDFIDDWYDEPTEEAIYLEGVFLDCMKETFTNLQYLILSGFGNNTEALYRNYQVFEQLISIEFVYNFPKWMNITQFTSNLSKTSSKLKHLAVERVLDSRDDCTQEEMEQFYNSHNCPISIAFGSISKLYSNSYE